MHTEEIVKAIIKEQSQVIGEYLAMSMAQNSGVVKFTSPKLEDITLTNTDGNFVIDAVVNSYKNLFGQASVDVCLSVINKYKVA
jgi:hypothetical protein